MSTITRWLHRYGLASALAAALGCVSPVVAAGTAGTDKPDTTVRIAFVGDSIVDNYWSGVTRIVAANSCLKNRIVIGRYARNSTGLTRGDKLYWPREVRRVEAAFKPTLMVVSLGLNDQQFIIDKTGHMTPWGAPNWADKYKAEIVEFLTEASATHAGVMLVGMPVMRDGGLNADVQTKNKWFTEAIASLKLKDVEYVEPWQLNGSGPDVYSSYGRDHNGKMTLVRTSDGQHFTVAGEDLTAAYLWPKILSALDRMGVNLGTCAGTSSSAK